MRRSGKRKSSDRKINSEIVHNSMVRKIFENPEILGVENLRETLIYSELEPRLSSTNTHTVDIILFYKPEDYEILAVELKVGLGYTAKGRRQLNYARLYFFEHWKEWLYEGLGERLHDLDPNRKIWFRGVVYCYDYFSMPPRIKGLPYTEVRQHIGYVTEVMDFYAERILKEGVQLQLPLSYTSV